MKNLYLAAQALLTWAKNNRKSKPGPPYSDLPFAIRHVLVAFESRNRGHQHQLNHAELYPAGGGPGWVGSPHAQTQRRSVTLRHTSAALYKVVLSLPAEDLTGPSQWQALLRTKGTGWLRYHLLGQLSLFLLTLRCPSHGFHVAWSSRLIADVFQITADVTGPSRTNQASRAWTFAVPESLSLLECRTIFEDISRELTAQVAGIEAWPEFSAEHRSSHMRAAARLKLEAALKDYCAADRQALAAQWDSLMPPCLQNCSPTPNA